MRSACVAAVVLATLTLLPPATAGDSAAIAAGRRSRRLRTPQGLRAPPQVHWPATRASPQPAALAGG